MKEKVTPYQVLKEKIAKHVVVEQKQPALVFDLAAYRAKKQGGPKDAA